MSTRNALALVAALGAVAVALAARRRNRSHAFSLGTGADHAGAGPVERTGDSSHDAD